MPGIGGFSILAELPSEKRGLSSVLRQPVGTCGTKIPIRKAPVSKTIPIRSEKNGASAEGGKGTG